MSKLARRAARGVIGAVCGTNPRPRDVVPACPEPLPMTLRRLPLRLVLPFLAFAALVGPATPARAYEEQVTVGLAVDYAVAPLADPDALHGLNGGLVTSYGLGDTFSLEARLEHAALVRGLEWRNLSRATVGLTYAIDVLTLVPLFGVGVGGALGVSNGDVEGDVVLYGSFALDYLFDSRRWLLGVEARAEVLPIGSIDFADRLLVTAGLRVAMIFDTY